MGQNPLVEGSQASAYDKTSLGPRCGEGGSGYFTWVSVRMDPSCPLRSSSCDLLDLSAWGNPASQETCAQELWENSSRQHNTKEMPSNGKNHKKEFKCSPLTGDRCKFTIRGRLETGKIRIPHSQPKSALSWLDSCPQMSTNSITGAPTGISSPETTQASDGEILFSREWGSSCSYWNISLLWYTVSLDTDVSLELSCFFDDPANFGNLISGSSAFSKCSLNI